MLEKLDDKKQLEQDMEYTKDKVLQKFPLLGVTLSQLKIIPKEEVGTAGTDGKVVYYSPKFFKSLPDNEKAFVLAHEVMHVAFNHIMRSKDRDQRLWNIATDSVINQILKNEGMPIVEGGVNMEEAINRSSEEMYEKLLKDKKDPQKEKRQDGNANKNKGDADDNKDGADNDSNEQAGHDNHEIWKEAVEQAEKDGHEQQKKQPLSQDSSEQADEIDMEKSFSEDNRRERNEIIKKIREDLEKRKNKVMSEMAENNDLSLGAVGESVAVLNWKKVLKNSLDNEEDRWSYRRATADNDYMARVEEIEDENRAETEVMLDVSGSVNEKLLKEFLRQLKPILKTSKLKVGCFDENFYGLTEIKTNADIDNFKVISKAGWTENWDLAVKSFSKKKEVNKIVFTDGRPEPGILPDESTRGINVIWLVYGNKDFNPVCGKVILLDPNKIKQNYLAKEMISKKAGFHR